MDASGGGGVDVLGEGVGGGPVVLGVVPEGSEERSEGGGVWGGEVAEVFGGHGAAGDFWTESRRIARCTSFGE